MLILTICTVLDFFARALFTPIATNFSRDMMGNPTGCPLAAKNETLLRFNSTICQTSRNIQNSNTGLVDTAYNLGVMIGMLWLPSFIQRYGPRAGLILTIFGSFVGLLSLSFTCPTDQTIPGICTGFPGGFYALLVIRLLCGNFGGIYIISMQYITIQFDVNDKPKQFAKLNSLLAIAYVFGPICGALISQYNFRFPVYVASALTSVSLLIALAFLPEPIFRQLPKNELVDSTKNEKPQNVTVPEKKESFKCDVHIVAVQRFLAEVCFTAMVSLLGILMLEERFGIVNQSDSVPEQGQKVAIFLMMLVTAMAIAHIFSSLIVFPVAVKGIGLVKSIMIGLCIAATSLTFVPVYQSIWLLFLTVTVFSFGRGIYSNASDLLLTSMSKPGNVAHTLAYGFMIESLGGIVGPILLQLLIINPALPYYAAAASGFLGAIVLFFKPTVRNSSSTTLDIVETIDASDRSFRFLSVPFSPGRGSGFDIKLNVQQQRTVSSLHRQTLNKILPDGYKTSDDETAQKMNSRCTILNIKSKLVGIYLFTRWYGPLVYIAIVLDGMPLLQNSYIALMVTIYAVALFKLFDCSQPKFMWFTYSMVSEKLKSTLRVIRAKLVERRKNLPERPILGPTVVCDPFRKSSKFTSQHTKTPLILSLDGGGSKIYVTYVILQRLKKIFPNLEDEITMCAGTSAGAFYATLIATGKRRGKFK